MSKVISTNLYYITPTTIKDIILQDEFNINSFNILSNTKCTFLLMKKRIFICVDLFGASKTTNIIKCTINNKKKLFVQQIYQRETKTNF
jgi:hypothetical protein